MTEGERLNSLRECLHCGLICRMPKAKLGLVVDCPQCHNILWQRQAHSFNYIIACGLAAALFYCFSIVAPFLEISAYGRYQLAKIETGPNQLNLSGFEIVGILVLAVTVIIPAIKIALLLITLIGLEARLLPARTLKFLFRWYEPLKPWAMIDVYLLGFMVAYTRLAAMASVHLDTALFSLIGVMISMAAADAALDPETVWMALDDAASRDTGFVKSASGAGLIGCHCCKMVNRVKPGDACRRCNTVLHIRKAGSLGRSFALLLAAAVLYIPANIYPVMSITTLGSVEPFTIMAGIVELINAHLWPLALLVFFASISIPLAKIITLAYLLWQTRMNRIGHLLARTRAYRVLIFVGRWSMIDVFMISILVALVRFGQFTNIEASVGAPCFAAVVVLTIFAVDSFDPRLMWDAKAKAGRKAKENGIYNTGVASI